MGQANLTGIQFRARTGGQTYWIRPCRDGNYPINHPKWGEKYSDPGLQVTASSDGYMVPTHDLEVIEYLTQPKFQSEIVIVWPGQDFREYPRGQVRNFGTSMTEWEIVELAKWTAKIKAEDGIVDEPPAEPLKTVREGNVNYYKKKRAQAVVAE